MKKTFHSRRQAKKNLKNINAGSKSMSTADEKRMEITVGEAKNSMNEDGSKQQTISSDLSGGNLDKIREILFGNQMRNYEKRLTRLEERVVIETTDLREDLRKRFDSLELFIKKEVESLGDRIKA